MQLNWAPIFFQSLKNCAQNHTKSSINQILFFPKTKTESFFQNQELDHTGTWVAPG
jgi:hypothetical protein